MSPRVFVLILNFKLSFLGLMYFHYAAMMWSSQQLCHQNEIFLGKKNPFMFLAGGFQAELTGVVCNTSMFDYQKARLKIIPLFPTTSYLFIPVRATKDFQRVCISLN